MQFNDLNNVRVAVAGGTGLLGAALIQKLISGYPKIKLAASSYSTAPFLTDSRVVFSRCDLLKKQDCINFIAGCDCAVIASVISGGAGFNSGNPWSITAENVRMYINLLEACCEQKVKKIIFVGSATLYQRHEGLIKETDIDYNQDPESIYFGLGWGMRFVEKLCQWASREFGVQIIMARVSNIYGPYDRFDAERAHFIPALIRKAVGGQDPFVILGQAEVERDVVFVEDVSDAVIKMLVADLPGNDIFNIGSGAGVTVGRVAELILSSCEFSPRQIKYTGKGPATFKNRVLDCSKAADVLGWRPQYPIETGIRKTVDWWKDNKGWWKR